MKTISSTFTRAATGTERQANYDFFWLMLWALAILDDSDRREKERRRKREQAKTAAQSKPKPPARPRPF